jgi:hypothetical protein
MYCVISLPRTASTTALHLIKQALSFIDPIYTKSETTSAFNPRYLSTEQIEEKFQRIMNTSPLPLMKIISNHDFEMIKRIINSSYKTVFIKPVDLRKQVLKVLVAKKTDSFSNKQVREQYLNTLEFTDAEILERLQYHKRHLEFEQLCDYVVTDLDILNRPVEFVENLGLSYMGTRYKYVPFKYTDEDMLRDPDAFYSQYDYVFKLFSSRT